MSIELLKDGDQLLGMVVRSNFNKPGVSFLTNPEFEMQVAVMIHPKGKNIAPHRHQKNERRIETTSEVLLLKKGSLKVNFYSQDTSFLFHRILNAGDLILLVGGGHGFEVLEDLEMVEIKQGPFLGDNDKIRFSSKNETPL